jgi:multiple sugar transport system substrate-binding protein
MTLSRRGFLAAAGATGLTAGLAACGTDSGSGGDATAGAAKGAELSVITPIFEEASGKEVLETVIAGDFAEDHPGTTLSVDYVPWDKLNEKLSTSIAGGLSTDIIMSGVGWTPPFAHKKVFGALPEEILDGLNIHPRLLDMCRYEGSLYALPYQMDGRMIVANKKHLAEVGITEAPTSLEDFRAMLKEFQGLGLSTPLDLFSNNIRQTWIHLMACYGGTLFSDDGSAVAFDDGTGEAAIQYMVDLIADGSTNFDVRLAEGQPRPFQQEQVAFEIIGSGTWPDLFEQTPELASEEGMDIWITPGAEGNDPVLFLGGTLLSVAERSQNKELSQQFLTNMYEPELIVAASNHGGRVPAITEVPQDETLDQNRFITFVLDNLDYAGAFEGGNPAWMEIRGKVGPEIEAAVTGAQSPADTIANLKAISEDALSRV